MIYFFIHASWRNIYSFVYSFFHLFIPSFIPSLIHLFILSFLLCCSCGLCGRSGSRIFLPDSTSFTCTGSAVRTLPEDCPHHHTATRLCYRFTLVADILQIVYTRGQHTPKVNPDTVFFLEILSIPSIQCIQ